MPNENNANSFYYFIGGFAVNIKIKKVPKRHFFNIYISFNKIQNMLKYYIYNKVKRSDFVNQRAINHARRAFYRDSFREEAKQKREQLKIQKEEEKDNLNKILDQKYNCYKYVIAITSNLEINFCFDSLKEKYIIKEFNFEEDFPLKTTKSRSIGIPRKTFLNKIFKFIEARRVKKIELKKLTEEEEEREFARAVKNYEIRKQARFLEFEKEEKDRKNKIDISNKIVEEYRKSYSNGTTESMIKYNLEILEKFKQSYPVATFSKQSVNFIFDEKTLCVVLNIDYDDLQFDYISFKHIKTKGIIEGKPIKVTEVKRILKEFIPGLAISVIDTIYKNDMYDNIGEIEIIIHINGTEVLKSQFYKNDYSDFILKDYNTISQLFWFKYKYKFPEILFNNSNL